MGGNRILMIAGGGTGGHIYPAIAIAQESVRRDPSRRIIFVGSERGLERTLVPKAGFPLELLDVGGLKGKSLAETIRNFLKLPLALFAAMRLLQKHQPSVVLGVGGYASGPALVAAALRRIPTVIHEQNAFPGVTNRFLAKFVDGVAVAFPDALARMRRADGVVTGNPVRTEFFDVRRAAGSGAGKRRLLVFGGSQGSRVLNDAMTGALLFLSREKDRLEIVHQTGTSDHARVSEAYRSSAFPTARIVAYLDPMVAEIEAADLIVARSGAMTIGELTAAGRAAILIPFAAATNNHQEVNARVVERAGGAMVITEAMLTPERLAGAISELASDPAKLGAMAEAARRLSPEGAAEKIVDFIEQIERN